MPAAPGFVTQPPAAPSSPQGIAVSSDVASAWPDWRWALPVLAVAIAGGFAWARRRRPASIDTWEETVAEPVAEEPAPAPESMPPTPPRPAPARAIASGLLEFEPIALRLSLVYATLQFRLRLTAQTAIPAGRVLGDMISAHGSLSQAVQLEPEPDELGLLRPFPPLAAGEVLEAFGELRLPLKAVRPVQQGGAAFMVPLVRLALLGDPDPAAPLLELGCVFTVGVPGHGPALAPLRFDTGPRDFTDLDAREIPAARRTSVTALDPARAAG